MIFILFYFFFSLTERAHFCGCIFFFHSTYIFVYCSGYKNKGRCVNLQQIVWRYSCAEFQNKQTKPILIAPPSFLHSSGNTLCRISAECNCKCTHKRRIPYLSEKPKEYFMSYYSATVDRTKKVYQIFTITTLPPQKKKKKKGWEGRGRGVKEITNSVINA